MIHTCPREDCIHNIHGRCVFFTGDLYFSICLDHGSMYERYEGEAREREEQKNQNNISTLI